MRRVVDIDEDGARVSPGRNSRIRSSCFDASASAKLVSPVTLPPGCDRLCTSPNPTGSAPVDITIGIFLVAWWTAMWRHRRRDDDGRVEPDHFLCEVRKAIEETIGEAKFESDIAPLDIAEPPSLAAKCCVTLRRGRCRAGVDDADERNRRLLRARRERPSCGRAAEKRNELAPLHVPYPEARRQGIVPAQTSASAVEWRAAADVRFGSKADMCSAKRHVRLVPIADIQRLLGASSYQRNTAVRGKIILISVNSPSCVSTSIKPPCCLTIMSWLIERPSPVPSPGGLVVKNGLNIFSSTSGGIPVPLSRIFISTRVPQILGRSRKHRLVIATVDFRFTPRASVKSVRDHVQ